jgi:hypothetical protein
MVNKIVFGLLVVLISSGMGLGIVKNVKNKSDYQFPQSNQVQYSNDLKWDSPSSTQLPSTPHLSMDEIIKAGNEFISNYKTGIELVRIIETSKYFYIAFRETGSGIGAFELLADPVTGQMGFETGPSQFWNTKYGVWGSGKDMVNTVSTGQAQNNAIMFLKKENPLASLDPDPIDFHGYYSFFERQDNQIVGVLSVNGITGEVEQHDWLGKVLQIRDLNKNNS